MKFLRRLSGLKLPLLFPCLLVCALMTGCETVYESHDSAQSTNLAAVVFQIGEQVTVTFSGTQDDKKPHEERITEEGTITLELVGSVRAAGKTAGELQKDIYNLYVPKYYNSNSAFNVTVQAPYRSYSVGGEVKQPGPKAYIGLTTVTKAIQAAGDCTDFAKKTRVRLTRANGKTINVNYKKALEDPAFDPPVYPGDRIDVPRTVW